MKRDLTQRNYDTGDWEEPERLQSLGSSGYSREEILSVSADKCELHMQLHSLTRNQMPTQNNGNDPLVKLGHVTLVDSTDGESGLFVNLQTDAVVSGYVSHPCGPKLSRSSNGRGDEQRTSQSSRQTSSSDTDDDDDTVSDDTSTACSGSSSGCQSDNESDTISDFKRMLSSTSCKAAIG